jgi:signal transduction histidine kinase/DNA-binding response OmpR family regulator
MGRLIREKDWSATPLGPIATWGESLRTAVSICTASRYPMAIWWGAEAIQLYNDGYIDALGAKHPEALGQRALECWSEIWSVVGPLYEQVMRGGESTWSDDLLLLMDRYGYVEETYFTFSYSPIRGESGRVGGMLITCAETTARVIGERRLRTLRDLAARTTGARTVREACENALATLAENPIDLPAVALDLIEPGGSTPARFGVAGKAELLPPPDDSPALATIERAVVPSMAPDSHVLVLPVAGAGYLAVTASPRRPLDDSYRGFFELLSGHLAGAIANARAYEEAERRAQALAELDRAKTAFFSNVSHEFRTPLTLLLGPLEDALADPTEALGARQRERLSLAQRNGRRLLRLVNTLLQFTRLESGRVDAAFEPTDLAGLTADLASGFRSAAERAGLRLVIECAPLPEPVYVDRDMWEKIVLNLLSNALKFTLAGEIAVTLRAVGSEARLEVRDTGVGIAGEEMPRIFDRFHRVRESHGRSQEGTGIGLALVRELVALHGGRVDVTSAPGQGATFSVALPLGAGHLPADQVRSAAGRGADGRAAAAYAEEAARWLPPEAPATSGRRAGVRIVLADDNADMRDYVLRLLGEGWRVEAVADGERALETTMREPPDLLIADVMMPGLDGFALLQAVRSSERTRTVPVILLSARAGEEARLEGLRAGADDYLVKPFSARELLARVESMLALARVRREAEATVRASEERYRAYIELTSDAIWRIELEEPVPVSLPPEAQIDRFYAHAALAECNEAMAQMYGFGSAAELVGVRLGDLLPRDDPHNLDYLRRFISSGYRLADAESNEIGRDGQPRYFVNNLFGVVENGYLVRAWGSQRDVTERRRTLDRLQQAQRMESVGKLAGGIAHEVNNMMSVVLGCSEFVLRRPDLHPAVRTDVEQVREAAERSAAITAQLLAFSRRQMLRPVPLDLNAVVRELEPVLRRTLGEAVSLELRLATPLGAIRADRGQLHQVLLNLALNARDAMPLGGEVTIDTAAVELGPVDLAEHPEVRLRQGPYALLRMSDTGHGMDHETARHVFEPFFTTKGIGKGTGLGLSTVYGIVKQSDGYIWVDSEPGQGASFRIYLPRVDAPVAVDPPASVPGASSASERVLVVEDETMVRAMVVRSLREEGYGVLEAAGAAEALSVLDRTGADVRLVITDLAMAEIGGRELGLRLAERRPGLPVLYMSGYPLDEVVRRGLLEESQPFLQKPFAPVALLESVRALLDASTLGPPPAAALAARE